MLMYCADFRRSLLLIISLCTVFSTILRLPCMHHADFAVVHVNKRLTGYEIATHENTNDIQCTVKCVEHHKCRSYNFNRNEKICLLNSKAFGDNDTKLTDSPDWCYKSTDYNNTLVGPTCEELKPCQVGTLCKDTCTSPFYECITCDENHTGLHCDKLIDTDECSGNPCKHGSCVDGYASYKCTCFNGYTGKNCETEIDECESLPCFNGGACSNMIGHHKCNCVPGFTGVHCENDIDECESNPCKNNGTCTNNINNYQCNCQNGSLGTNCETVIGESCKEIKEKYPNYVSGRYVINAARIGEENTMVYCDMDTDGGGWTQVLYVTSNTDDYNVFKSKPLRKISTLTGFTASGNYGMKTSALADLRKITKFQQLRFRCKTRAHTNRLINIKTVMNPFGAAVVEYFCNTTADNPASCRSYEAYDDDDSWLTPDCLSWWGSQWSSLDENEKLFSHPIVKFAALHWNILPEADRFECDDPFQTRVIGNGDIWEVYAR